MEEYAQIELHITSTAGDDSLSLDTFDIKEVISVLTNFEHIIYPSKKSERPIISFRMEEGSVRHIFKVPKELQISIITLMSTISATGSIDSIDGIQAKAIEEFQNLAKKNSYSYEFRLPTNDLSLLKVTPETHFYRTENILVDADLYFYGTIVDAGGKDNSNIHLETENDGTLVISVERDILKNEKKNLLYKITGVHVSGKLNPINGEIDKNSLSLKDFLDYTQDYDENYINHLIEKVGDKFSEKDVDDYIAEIRGKI